MEEQLLSIHDLDISIVNGGGHTSAVRGTSFDIARGETFALLGESGCGKSMTAFAIMQLLPQAASFNGNSHIQFDQFTLNELPEIELRALRGQRISMIFQEPMTSLNPVMSVGHQISEVLHCHTDLKNQALLNRVLELLDAVGIPESKRIIHEYPHQLSGGMKQRIMIAMAIASEPDLLIADEPTTALDVTIQAQVLDLLSSIQKKNHMAMLFITHDLGVVHKMADRVGVMYAGHLVETAPGHIFFEKPLHPYSSKLFDSVPTLAKRDQRLATIPGIVPKLDREFNQCRFADRCEFAWDTCFNVAPAWTLCDTNRHVRCHLYDTRYSEGKGLPERITIQHKEEATYQSPSAETVLSVNDLKVHFPIQKGLLKRTVGYVKAVDGISFDIKKGQTLALVGESGSGKTSTGMAILRLIKATSGDVQFNGQDLLAFNQSQLRRVREDLQMIFQDPFSSMNPRMMINDIINEGIRAQHKKANVDELLQQVGLPTDIKDRYPHEFSGGQRQRICIARALALSPKLIICDEPTSALDVSVQAQILNLLKSLQQQLGLSYLFITHNMAVVAYLADEVAVMYQGKIVEHGSTEKILTSPEHPYTKSLLAAIPVV